MSAKPDNIELRDWLAAQATDTDVEFWTTWAPITGGFLKAQGTVSREQAKYRYADAMLAARATGNGGKA